MSLMNIKNMKNEKGFTIVELLIVIVVIGILAAITIVAYNGVQNRSKLSSAQAAANSVVKKAEIYNVEPTTPSGYPVLGANLTGAATTTTYYLSGVSFTSAATAMTAAPATPNTLDFWTCGATTGIKVGYWDYVAGSVAYVYAGSANSGTTCTKTTS